jgi:hypothetical protein
VRNPIVAAASLCLLCLASAAFGALGGDHASVVKDREGFRATHTTTSTQSTYTDNVLTLDSGVVVHEYSRSDNVVFAVTWQGPVTPDLHQLLGDYFPKYLAARSAHSSSGRIASISQFHTRQNGLVIHSGGHMGAFNGLIYAPALVPTGVDAEKLAE